MDSFLYFRINTPAVVHESFDDEVILIQLESGNYYSLNTSGAQIWAYVQQGLHGAEIVAALTTLYSIDAGKLVAVVHNFLAELQTEQLIIQQLTPSRQESGREETAPACQTQDRQVNFISPVLQKYTDMQDLLLLDPIHDVAESGWPHTKQPLEVH